MAPWANSTDEIYVPTPGRFSTRVVVGSLATISSIIGIVGNSLVLFTEWKRCRGSNGQVRLFERPLTMYFVNSLAMTDFCNSVINIPLFVINMFREFLVYEVGCLAYSITLFTLPAVTILNLLVISVERYLAIFFPLKAPDRRLSRKLVIGAWIIGFMIGILTTLTMDIIRYDIDESNYALTCTYDKYKSWKNRLYTVIAIMVFFLPSVVMFYTASRTVSFLHKRKQQIATGRIKKLSYYKRTRSFADTQLLMNVVFAFIVPYSLFFVYNMIKTFAKVELSFQEDYTARIVSALTALSNSAINPIIYICGSRKIRRRIVKMFRKSSRTSSRAEKPKEK